MQKSQQINNLIFQTVTNNRYQKSNLYQKKVKYLQSYFWIIQDLLDELIRNQEEDSIIKASKISGMPKRQLIRTIDDIYIEKQRNQINIEKRIDDLYNKKKKIENIIKDVEDPHLRYVLRNKYLFFKTIEEISLNLDKSYRQIIRWHTEAINRLEILDL